MQEDYFTSYMQYAGAGVSEPPASFHRWCSISIIGALLGRQYSFPFGHSQIYPNQYINLMGAPGTRKSTAINIAAKLAKAVGYKKFAADRVSKEKFLLDMGAPEEGMEEDDILDMCFDDPSECFVVADEFTDFIGTGNMEFITLLTKLWDNPSEYKHPKIHGKDAIISKPTVNILSGNTAQGFALAFPPEAIGNGFLSRTLFIHGDTTGRKITFPPKPNEQLALSLVNHLKEMCAVVKGEAHVEDNALALCDRIYREFVDIDDVRFKSYSTRRFTHVLKLALCISAAALRTVITSEDILKANTLLYHAENHMPQALGEYGKSKTSDQANAVLNLLSEAKAPMTSTEIWKKVHQDFSKIAELAEVVRNLQHAEKIQLLKIGNKEGFLPMVKRKQHWADDLLLNNWLTLEEIS